MSGRAHSVAARLPEPGFGVRLRFDSSPLRQNSSNSSSYQSSRRRSFSMSVRNLDLPSIVGRIRAPAKGAEPSINSGAASKIEIPDPVTLLELAAQAGVTLEWVLYGGGEQEPGSAASAGSKRDHPPPVNLVLQQPAMVELRELLSGPMLTKAVREALASWTPHATIDAAEAIAGVAAAQARAQCLTARDYINATGIIVHTGWGNAPLATAARERLLASRRRNANGSSRHPRQNRDLRADAARLDQCGARDDHHVERRVAPLDRRRPCVRPGHRRGGERLDRDQRGRPRPRHRRGFGRAGRAGRRSQLRKYRGFSPSDHARLPPCSCAVTHRTSPRPDMWSMSPTSISDGWPRSAACRLWSILAAAVLSISPSAGCLSARPFHKRSAMARTWCWRAATRSSAGRKPASSSAKRV